MNEESFGSLGAIKGFDNVRKKFDPHYASPFSLRDDYAFVDKKISMLRPFQGLQPDQDFGVHQNRVAACGLEADVSYGAHQAYHAWETWVLNKHGVDNVWVLSALWVDVPVIGMRREVLKDYRSYNSPSHLGAFIEEMASRGYRASMNEAWLPVLEDKMIVAFLMPHCLEGVYYFATLPTEIVTEYGYLDAEGSPVSGWYPFTGNHSKQLLNKAAGYISRNSRK